MQSLTRLTVFLCCAWALALLYGDMVAYWIPLWCCSWPLLSNSSSSAGQVRVAVVADPQLMDRTSLGLAPKSFALEAAQFYTDIYMRRAFRASILPFRPNVVVFLGDHFDGGLTLTDEEWQESLSRFKHIFSLNDERRKSDVSVYYLSGNHDIGYSGFLSHHPEVISRYEKEFGSRNYNFSAGMVDFVVVDAQTLDGPLQGAQATSSWEFIKNMSKVDSSRPRVLLTHIPLYRADDTPCGPYRSSPSINQRISYAGTDGEIVYQNYLTEETSSQLLKLIKPILVLSGHDHDQCTVNHLTIFGAIPEHTLGTISWQQGNLYPSFMLLSAMASSNTTSIKNFVSTQLCFMPRQTHIYIWYLSQFIITLLLLILWPVNGFGCCDWFSECIKSIISIRRNMIVPSKEKVDEEICDYEMVWDAEGSMHLVKKATTQAPVTKPDIGSTGRGNVTIRQTVKKNIVQEPEPSISLDLGRAPRQSKSKARRLIQRLVRVVQLLSIIAAVNVPLYMMLLFKDWI